jgi:hypothetical protein
MANTAAIRREIDQKFDSLTLATNVPGAVGTTYYLDSVTGDDDNSGVDRSHPLATIAGGLAALAAGDTLIILPTHAETVTAAPTVDVACRIIGLGWGRYRPAFTASGAIDCFSIEAANVHLENVRLLGNTASVTSCLNIAESDFYGKNISIEQAATPLAGVTVTADGDRFILEDCNWIGTAAGPDYGILIEGKADGWKLIRPVANYAGSSGLDLAFLASSFKMKEYLIDRPIVVGFDTLAIDINSSTAALGDGMCIGGRFMADAAVTIANVIDVGGCAFIDCIFNDSVAAKGLTLPAATPA